MPTTPIRVQEEEAPADPQTAAANLRKVLAEARKLEAEARQAELSALIPDLSKVTIPELGSREAGTAIGQSRVTFAAIEKLADTVVERVAKTNPTVILVTNDIDLATGDAIYSDIESHLDDLTSAADKLLEDVDAEWVGAGIAILASVLPYAVSLMMPRRSVATSAVTVDDLAVGAAVMQRLIAKNIRVVHADFRSVGTGGILDKVKALAERRRSLVTKKMDLIKAAGEGTVDPKVEAIDSLLGAVDAFTTAIRTKPDGGRTPLAVAALHESLYAQKGTRVSHVLLLKGQAGSAVDLRESKLGADKFTTMADVQATFLLFETQESRIIDAGNASATGVASGDIGKMPQVQAMVRK